MSGQVIAVIHPMWLYHILDWPMSSNGGYPFDSGFGSDLGELSLLVAGVTVARMAHKRIRSHLECHVDGCTNIGHPVHGTGYRACHAHHPGVSHVPGEAVTAEHIRDAHGRAR